MHRLDNENPARCGDSEPGAQASSRDNNYIAPPPENKPEILEPRPTRPQSKSEREVLALLDLLAAEAFESSPDANHQIKIERVYSDYPLLFSLAATAKGWSLTSKHGYKPNDNDYAFVEQRLTRLADRIHYENGKIHLSSAQKTAVKKLAEEAAQREAARKAKHFKKELENWKKARGALFKPHSDASRSISGYFQDRGHLAIPRNRFAYAGIDREGWITTQVHSLKASGLLGFHKTKIAWDSGPEGSHIVNLRDDRGRSIRVTRGTIEGGFIPLWDLLTSR